MIQSDVDETISVQLIGITIYWGRLWGPVPTTQ